MRQQSKPPSMYLDIITNHIFYPVAIKTAGSRKVQVLKLMEEIERWVIAATDDQNKTMCTFSRGFPWQ